LRKGINRGDGSSGERNRQKGETKEGKSPEEQNPRNINKNKRKKGKKAIEEVP